MKVGLIIKQFGHSIMRDGLVRIDLQCILVGAHSLDIIPLLLEVPRKREGHGDLQFLGIAQELVVWIEDHLLRKSIGKDLEG